MLGVTVHAVIGASAVIGDAAVIGATVAVGAGVAMLAAVKMVAAVGMLAAVKIVAAVKRGGVLDARGFFLSLASCLASGVLLGLGVEAAGVLFLLLYSS